MFKAFPELFINVKKIMKAEIKKKKSELETLEKTTSRVIKKLIVLEMKSNV